MQDDSIEHYSQCRVSVAFARNHLRIRPPSFHLGQLVALGLTDERLQRDEIVIRAIWAYALYRTHNLLRFRPLADGESPIDILSQFAKEGVMGHAGAMACLDGRWAARSIQNWGARHIEPDARQSDLDNLLDQ